MLFHISVLKQAFESKFSCNLKRHSHEIVRNKHIQYVALQCGLFAMFAGAGGDIANIIHDRKILLSIYLSTCIHILLFQICWSLRTGFGRGGESDSRLEGRTGKRDETCHRDGTGKRDEKAKNGTC